ncbi:diacylglycerol kinase family protein [uncultured Formosa sp.]|uniref:diacylglycerol/lipid kinase family protein n=1 Tax=uncultured Formosa sp. TaxID=255435 RepID=UPI0026107BE3|nr:diacylglycerol kinase family protein [uncultured Formosa sp.]
MIHIHFIVNPISGQGNYGFENINLDDFFEKIYYNITVKYSEFKGHAICLAKASISEKADVVVACGGDGTINEIASVLVDSGISLGIIPLGSGNGLASNLKIPQDIVKALGVIKKNTKTKIDVGCINQFYFFSNSGFGFDAKVISHYEASKKRTLYAYLSATFKSFLQSNSNTITIDVNGKKTIENPFLIFISNSNKLGYNMSLTPKASLEDGLLDVIIVPTISTFKMVVFGALMLLKKIEWMKEVKGFQTKILTLKLKSGDVFESQVDGELLSIRGKSVVISLKEKALTVIV